MALTAKEIRLIRKISRPWWPRLTLYCFLAFLICGVVSIGLAIAGCVKLSHMAEAGIQPATMTVFSDTWLSLMVGGIALMSSIFMWGTRRFGLLIRKLGDKDEK